jgi:hypothetical protein
LIKILKKSPENSGLLNSLKKILFYFIINFEVDVFEPSETFKI